MFRTAIAAITLASMAGCSGIVIKQLTPASVASHAEGEQGYVVYAPIVMLSIAPAEKGGCVISQITVPDYRRPYRIDSKSGLGKSGTNFTITDGWRLGGFTDNSDNSGLFPLGTMIETWGLTPDVSPATDSCPSAGIYRLDRRLDGTTTYSKLGANPAEW